MEPTSSGIAGAAALIKTMGLSAFVGMIGAALLYVVTPPVNRDGSFNRREFVARLASAGVFSIMFGDIGVEFVNHFAPFLHADIHREAVDILVGAPGWWISRAIALWLQKQKDKDIGQVVAEVKGGMQ